MLEQIFGDKNKIMRIKTKIFSIVLLVILITGVTSIAISSFVSKNMLKNEIYNHLENVVHSRGRNIDMLLIDYQNIVKILGFVVRQHKRQLVLQLH